ncbi:ERF family protein [Micromonospora carbonacea]|uniref:ERF superfamily protein n=1 Tax=Micromonospora carbonacea TaxID=47853 RepID=A0A1C4WWT2_9ACTN|nr:ERF family protein [Micromonospora carbonacea]SCF00639.1 ERF superfamily protein [Micromonospora carbonacea]
MTAPTPPGLANLAAALAKVQTKLPKLERDRTVEVEKKAGGTYTYSYVTLANLSDAILPLLAEHGLSFAALPGAGSDGKMCVRYHLMHESGEVLAGEFPISGEGGIQMIGGRITYARRYCLAAIVGVAADEDDESRLADDGARGTAQRAAPRQRQQRPASETGTATARQASPTGGQPPLPTDSSAGLSPAQRGMVQALFGKVGVQDRGARLNVAAQLVGRQLASSNELTKAEASALIDTLDKASKADDPGAALAEALAAAAETGADR